ncbi:acetyltransferase [Bacillus australimaris]|uniref:Acetyltransferase n=1 Tax=Bacillus australimaris TaxID=1326968 RepID=A0ABD4QHB3_9BACI|nr:acetyltransferase [Bacillus australimaris]KPN14635.1 acetyltransferase [Bacillus australimaris]MBR8689791.1 acetyltransferase [Bacillus australimaris]
MPQLKNSKEPICNEQTIGLIGAGGHSKVIQDLIFAHPDYSLCAVLDDQFEETVTQSGILYGPISMSQQLRETMPQTKWLIAIGQNEVRQLIKERLSFEDAAFATLIHPEAITSPSAVIGRGTVVMARAVIQADAVIGEHTIINTGSIVEHDCRLESFVHLSPGAVLTGCVSVRDGAHIGAGAVAIPGTTIGSWTVIGAGAAVTKDINDQKVAIGIPAIEIKDRKEGGK